METLDLFSTGGAESLLGAVDQADGWTALRPIFGESPPERATRRITSVLRDKHPLVVAFSAGKDSSVLTSLVLNAARNLLEAGEYCPPIVVTHGNTGVEQPEIVTLAHEELRKMQTYAKCHGIRLSVHISHPKLSDSWPVRVIGGRALPPYPSTRADCSTDWKVLPNQRTTAQVMQLLRAQEDLREPVVLTGVRIDESVVRNTRIAQRGEKAEGIWTNEFGFLRLSPILDFTTDDVWEYIGYANAGVVESFSDFSDTMRIYKAGGGDSCVIVADMKSGGHSKPCGTRTGCWACTRVGEDRSMINMIESDEKRYGYLRPLSRLRDWLSNAQYDWSLRQYVGRTIDANGDIAIQADTFNAQTLQNLLRYTLTAQRLSGVPIIGAEQLIAIDARWSLYGLCPPFAALKIYFEVEEEGKLEEAPVLPRFPHTEVPRVGTIQVGAAEYGSALPGRVSGLRNVAWELFSESCGMRLKNLANGHAVVDVESDGEVEVDEEGAYLFLELEAKRHIADYCHEACTDWTWGYKTYLAYGTISIAKGRSRQIDEILQRTQWRQANNLHGYRTAEELEQRCTALRPKQLDLV